MHLRGKRFEYNIVWPGQGAETLLRVNYDFYWQLSYRLAVPRFLKAGTELQSVAWYDNSRNNPHNPDPESAVHWGDQTYDEMMVGFSILQCPQAWINSTISSGSLQETAIPTDRSAIQTRKRLEKRLR
jgi:hypothetical protein